MTTGKRHLGLALFLGTLATIGLLALMGGGGTGLAAAEPETNVVHTVCKTWPADCDHATVQDALDAAGEGDLIKIATGVYSNVVDRPVPPSYPAPAGLNAVHQVAYITKSITLEGGYTTAFTDPPDPEVNPTTLDACGVGRAVLIAGEISVTIEGLRITGGDATGLAGMLGSVDAGGGVYGAVAYGTDATITLRENLVFSNSATYGGGVLLLYTSGVLADNTIYSNTAD